MVHFVINHLESIVPTLESEFGRAVQQVVLNPVARSEHVSGKRDFVTVICEPAVGVTAARWMAR